MSSIIKQSSFVGGEFAPLYWGRSDLPGYANGLRRCRNWFVTKQGAVVTRPGTATVADARYSTAANALVRLIPFIYSDTQSYVLEFGDLYIRVWTPGAAFMTTDWVQPVDGAAATYITTPYAYTELAAIRYAQVGDVLTLTHPSHAPRELKRLAHTNWTLSTVTFDRPTITVPAATPFRLDNATLPVADATHPAREWTWKVTQIRRDPATGVVTETAPFTVTNTTAGAVAARYAVYYDKPVTIVTGLTAAEITALTADPNFIAYRYYRGRGGLFGWLGDGKTDDFTDVGQEPDYSIPPPQGRNPFAVSVFSAIGGLVRAGTTVTVTTTTAHGLRVGDTFVLAPGEINFPAAPSPKTVVAVTSATVFTYTEAGAAVASTVAHTITRTENPTAVTFFQERRVFGATAFRPGFLFASATGDYANFDEAMLPVAGQALAFELAARRRESIRQFLSHNKLLTWTNASVWTFDGAGGPLDSDSVEARVIEEIGISANLPPLLVDGAAIYSRAKGVGVRALLFAGDASYQGADISAISQHLLVGFGGVYAGIRDWTYAEDPFGVVWATTNGGRALSLTFSRDGQMAAWAEHVTESGGIGYGSFISACAIPSGDEDVVYFATQRYNAAGVLTYRIERMASRQAAGIGWSVDGASTGTVAAGSVAAPFADGTYVQVIALGLPANGPYSLLAVAGGAVTTTVPDGTFVAVGLPITASLEALDAPRDLATATCVNVGLDVVGNVGLRVGATADTATTAWTPATADVLYDSGAATSMSLATRIVVPSGWGHARVGIVQARGMWTTIVGLVREFDRGT